MPIYHQPRDITQYAAGTAGDERGRPGRRGATQQGGFFSLAFAVAVLFVCGAGTAGLQELSAISAASTGGQAASKSAARPAAPGAQTQVAGIAGKSHSPTASRKD